VSNGIKISQSLE